MAQHQTPYKTESGKQIHVGDLLFTVKSLRNGVVVFSEETGKYFVVFHEKGNKFSCFDLEQCLHLKHVGNVVENPNGWK